MPYFEVINPFDKNRVDEIVNEYPDLSKVPLEVRKEILTRAKDLSYWINLGFQPTEKELLVYEGYFPYSCLSNVDHYISLSGGNINRKLVKEILSSDEYLSPKNVYRLAMKRNFESLEMIHESHPFLGEINEFNKVHMTYAESVIHNLDNLKDKEDTVNYILDNFEVDKKRVLLDLIYGDFLPGVQRIYAEGITLEFIESIDYRSLRYGHNVEREMFQFLYDNTDQTSLSNFLLHTLRKIYKRAELKDMHFYGMVEDVYKLTIYLAKTVGDNDIESYLDKIKL